MAIKGRPPKRAKIVSACGSCGARIEKYPYEVGQKFCSRECWRRGRIGKARGPYIEREEKRCELCGKPFLVGGATKPMATRFCSIKCSTGARGGHPKAREMSEVEAAWFAGVFDGEGNVAWPRPKNLHSVRLSISNTSLPLLKRVEKVSGTGKILDRRRTSTKHSPVWVWNCTAFNSLTVLRQILPWLIVKKRAAEVALGLVSATEPPLTQRTLQSLAPPTGLQ